MCISESQTASGLIGYPGSDIGLLEIPANDRIVVKKAMLIVLIGLIDYLELLWLQY